MPVIDFRGVQQAVSGRIQRLSEAIMFKQNKQFEQLRNSQVVALENRKLDLEKQKMDQAFKIQSDANNIASEQLDLSKKKHGFEVFKNAQDFISGQIDSFNNLLVKQFPGTSKQTTSKNVKIESLPGDGGVSIKDKDSGRVIAIETQRQRMAFASDKLSDINQMIASGNYEEGVRQLGIYGELVLKGAPEGAKARMVRGASEQMLGTATNDYGVMAKSVISKLYPNLPDQAAFTSVTDSVSQASKEFVAELNKNPDSDWNKQVPLLMAKYSAKIPKENYQAFLSHTLQQAANIRSSVDSKIVKKIDSQYRQMQNTAVNTFANHLLGKITPLLQSDPMALLDTISSTGGGLQLLAHESSSGNTFALMSLVNSQLRSKYISMEKEPDQNFIAQQQGMVLNWVRHNLIESTASGDAELAIDHKLNEAQRNPSALDGTRMGQLVDMLTNAQRQKTVIDRQNDSMVHTEMLEGFESKKLLGVDIKKYNTILGANGRVDPIYEEDGYGSKEVVGSKIVNPMQVIRDGLKLKFDVGENESEGEFKLDGDASSAATNGVKDLNYQGAMMLFDNTNEALDSWRNQVTTVKLPGIGTFAVPVNGKGEMHPFTKVSLLNQNISSYSNAGNPITYPNVKFLNLEDRQFMSQSVIGREFGMPDLTSAGAAALIKQKLIEFASPEVQKNLQGLKSSELESYIDKAGLITPEDAVLYMNKEMQSAVDAGHYELAGTWQKLKDDFGITKAEYNNYQKGKTSERISASVGSVPSIAEESKALKERADTLIKQFDTMESIALYGNPSCKKTLQDRAKARAIASGDYSMIDQADSNVIEKALKYTVVPAAQGIEGVFNGVVAVADYITERESQGFTFSDDIKELVDNILPTRPVNFSDVASDVLAPSIAMTDRNLSELASPVEDRHTLRIDVSNLLDVAMSRAGASVMKNGVKSFLKEAPHIIVDQARNGVKSFLKKAPNILVDQTRSAAGRIYNAINNALPGHSFTIPNDKNIIDEMRQAESKYYTITSSRSTFTKLTDEEILAYKAKARHMVIDKYFGKHPDIDVIKSAYDQIGNFKKAKTLKQISDENFEEFSRPVREAAQVAGILYSDLKGKANNQPLE